MSNLLINTKNAYFYYCYYSFPVSLILVAGLFLFLGKSKSRKEVRYYFATAMAITVCPLCIYLIIRGWMPMTEYWKIYYLIPAFPMLAYVAADYWGTASGRKKQWIITAVFVIIIGMAIQFNGSFHQIHFIENPYRVSEQVLSVSELLQEKGLEKEPIIIPQSLKGQLCAYRENVIVAEVLTSEDEKVFRGETWLEPGGALDNKLELLKEGYASVIVLEASYQNEGFMKENGFTLLCENGDYYIYSCAE